MLFGESKLQQSGAANAERQECESCLMTIVEDTILFCVKTNQNRIEMYR